MITEQNQANVFHHRLMHLLSMEDDIEDEDAFPEIDIQDANNEILSLESSLLDAKTALARCQRQQGVSRVDLQGFEDLLPDDYPLASFTKKPTQTNYDVATIALENRITQIFMAIVKAIVNLIRRLLKWVFGRRRNEEKVDDQKRAAEPKLLKAINDASESEGQGSEAFRREVARINERYQGSWNGLTEGMLYKRSDVVDQVKAFFNVRNTVVVEGTAHIADLFDFYQGALEKVSKDQTGGIQPASEMASVWRVIEAHSKEVSSTIDNTFPKVGEVADGKIETLQQPVSRMRAGIDKLEQGNTSRPFDVWQIMQDYREKRVSFLMDWAEGYDFAFRDRDIKRALDTLERVEKDLNRFKPLELDDPELDKASRQTFWALKEEVVAITSYMETASRLNKLDSLIYDSMLSVTKILHMY